MIKSYLNREMSWLDFNGRVLQEALDKSNPLLERIKFLGIFSSNRDEFFRVRVATLNRMRNHKIVKDFEKKNLTRIINNVHKKVAEQEDIYTSVYQSLIDEARENNIFLITEKELSDEQKRYVKSYFNQEVRKHIFPLMLGDTLNYNNFKDQSVYLAVELKDSTGKSKNCHSLIELPTSDLPRFFNLPNIENKKYLIFLEDIVRANLDVVFSMLGYDQFDAYLIKITRDAELDIDNDVLKSFLEIMTESVKKRKKAPPIRFVYDKNITPDLLKEVLSVLNITTSDSLRPGSRYSNLKDFMNFPVRDPLLQFPPLPPLQHPDLPEGVNKFDVFRKKDILLHFPYHSFSHLTSLIWEAALDPNVRAIKMTFYRVSRHSTVMKGLINAARNGKSVTVFMELQPRFDEEDNIFWTQKLQEEGVKIIPTIPGYKVHAKLLLIRRKENGKNIYYSNISTGNFHEATARVYSDTSLFTSNQSICSDVNDLFHLFESSFNLPNFKKLKVAPFGARSLIINKINHEIKNHKAGLSSGVIIKVNSLVDEFVVKKIYQAADAGVKIKLIVRGICVIKAKQNHENIEAIGVVDRFLEHSRVFIFDNGGKPEYYISSADLMSRNLDHRIEVICPILSPENQAELQTIIDIQLRDNVKARNLQFPHINEYKTTSEIEPYQSQIKTYEFLAAKSRI